MKTFLCVIIRFTCDDFKGFYLLFFFLFFLGNQTGGKKMRARRSHREMREKRPAEAEAEAEEDACD